MSDGCDPGFYGCYDGWMIYELGILMVMFRYWCLSLG